MIYNKEDITYSNFLESIPKINHEILNNLLENQVGYEKDRFANFSKQFYGIELKFTEENKNYTTGTVNEFYQDYLGENYSLYKKKYDLDNISALLNQSKFRKLSKPELKTLFITLNDISRAEGFLELEILFLNEFQTMDPILEFSMILVCSGLLLKNNLKINFHNDNYSKMVIKGMKAIQFGLSSEYLKKLYS